MPSDLAPDPSKYTTPRYRTIALSTGDEHGFVLRPTGDPSRGRTPPGERATLRVRLQPWIAFRFVRLTIADRDPAMPSVDAQSWKFQIDELRIGRTLVVEDVPAACFSAVRDLGNTWLWLPQWHDRHDEILLQVTNRGIDASSFYARLDVAREDDPSRRTLAAPIFPDPTKPTAEQEARR